MTEQKKRRRPRKDPMIEAVEKKRGRPAGTRVKHVPTVASVRDEWSKKYSALVDQYEDMQSKAYNIADAQAQKIRSLEHQAIGYRAVISYLENTIELLIANPVRGN